jgi:hypothetical protein
LSGGRPKGTKTRNKSEKKICDDCKKSLPINNFYNTNSTLSTDGKLNICKKCIEKTIDPNNIETIYKILQLMDIPFLYTYWQTAKMSSPENPWGAYIRMANSKINEFKTYTWKDSIFENSETRNINNPIDSRKIYSEEWNGFYTQSDINYLNNYLKGLHEDFKIITTSHKDYAKKICCASLAVNKAYQDMLNGVTGADKRYKDLQATFDTLSKSAQFSENTRSNINAGISSISQIVDKVETKTWIYEPEDFKKDEIDHLLDQFNNIKKSL